MIDVKSSGVYNLKMCLLRFTDRIKAEVYVRLPLPHSNFILNVLKVSREYNFSLYYWGELWY